MERLPKGDLPDEPFAAEIEAVRNMAETWPIPKMEAAKLAAVIVNGTDINWPVFNRLAEYLSGMGAITYTRLEGDPKNYRFMGVQDVLIVVESQRYVQTHNQVLIKRGGQGKYIGVVQHLESTGLIEGSK